MSNCDLIELSKDDKARNRFDAALAKKRKKRKISGFFKVELKVAICFASELQTGQLGRLNP